MPTQFSGGKDATSFAVLATALAQKNEFAEAEKAADQAIAIATANKNTAFADAVRREKEAYREAQKNADR